MAAKKYSLLQKAIILFLFISILLQGILSSSYYPVMWDEPCFIGEGKAILSTGNMSFMVLMATAPPLSLYINSILLIPLNFDNKIWEHEACWGIGYDILFNSGYDYRKILFVSRIPFVFLSMIVAFYVLKWSTEIYGKKSGIIALFLYSFSTTIVAQSSMVTINFTCAAMVFIATYYYWKLINKNTKKYLILSGVFFGLALLSKILSIILIPFYIIIAIFEMNLKKYKTKLFDLMKRITIIFIIAFLIMFTFYLFQFGTFNDSLPPGHYTEKSKTEIQKFPIFADEAMYFFENIPVPIPTYFGMVGNLVYLSTQTTDNFVFGQIVESVPWYFIFLTFLLKTQIPLLMMIILYIIFHKNIKKTDLITNLSLILPILLVFLLLLNSSKASGIGHILLVYPFIFILVSNLININIKRKIYVKPILAILLFSYAISCISAAPDYLPYINILGGGPNNTYKILVGNSIDFGQDILGLKRYMEQNNIDKIKLSYWGSIDPKEYGINYEYMPSPYFQPWQSNYWEGNAHLSTAEKNIHEDCSERKGLIAISVTNLQNVHLVNKTCYKWLEKYDPIERIGSSIFVYNVTKN